VAVETRSGPGRSNRRELDLLFRKQRNPEGTPVFSAGSNLPGRRTMAGTVGAESGDERKTVVILSDRSREIIRLFEELQRRRRQAEHGQDPDVVSQQSDHD